MKILIEVPVWLGDTVMASVAVNNLIAHYPQAHVTVFGSYVATQVYQHFPQVHSVVVDESKQQGNRVLALYRTAKKLGQFDLAISFRRSFSSKLLMLFIRAKRKFNYRRLSKMQIHLAQRYNDFVNHVLGTQFVLNDIDLHTPKPASLAAPQKPLLGINPGATYGSAKRWYPEEFAKVAAALHEQYDIVIFGGANEIQMAKDIAQLLEQSHVFNYTNLAGQTKIDELIERISQLALFITNDSGPMHVAAAFKVKTVAIFGPTNHIETHQWHNPNELILRKPIECAPCMQRECPLKHHRCMKEIHATDVLSMLADQGWSKMAPISIVPNNPL